MKYARHAPSSYKVHLGYSRLTLKDIKRACDATDGSAPPNGSQRRWAKMSMAELLAAQREVAEEIQRRHARQGR
eukprot:7593824-Pyramimonas_sp.AAC.1